MYSVDVVTKTAAGRIKPQSLHACSREDLEKKLCSPLLIHRIDPQCTDEARRVELTGELVLGFVVNKVGNTEDARVLESLGRGLDEKAAAAVKQWRFRPAVYKGEPFPVHVKLAIVFACGKLR
jgi:TonB family protein